MCGIAGLMSLNCSRPSKEILYNLASKLRHRGPDGFGSHLVRDTGIIHRRLAIIDLKTGNQRLFGKNTRLVANAEIYNYLELSEMLKKEKFPITVHAGEWDGPERIRDAISLLHPTRLGHGVRSIEEPELVNHIKELGIVLEICPTSNLATKIYRSYEDHPVKLFYDQGVKITVNSDDPPFFNASIAGEYEVMKNLGLSDEELKSLTKNAIEHAFCDDNIKAKLLNKI